MTTDKYVSEQQQRLLRLIVTLSGNEIEGLAPSQIAKANECDPSQVTRDLANLAHIGWAEQIPVTGRWRLGPQIVQISMRHMTALERASRRLEETRQRFSRDVDTASAQRGLDRYSTGNPTGTPD